MAISYSVNNLTPQQQAMLLSQQEKVGGGGATVASLLASSIASSLATPIATNYILPKMQKIGQYDEANIKAVQNGAKEVIKKTGLDKFGVKINFLKQYKENAKAPIWVELTNPIEGVKNGRNALFLMSDAKEIATGKVVFPKNTILAPQRDLSYALFHELGHAHNHNLSKFGKILQMARVPGMYLPGIIALYGTFSRKSKPADGENLTNGQKVNNFIRDNAGKLSLLCTIPMLIEEGMATVKGNKWAKELLSPENAKKVSKGTWFAYTSYLATAGAMVLASWVAVKVKDKIIENKEKKREALFNSAFLQA